MHLSDGTCLVIAMLTDRIEKLMVSTTYQKAGITNIERNGHPKIWNHKDQGQHAEKRDLKQKVTSPLTL
jgi:predicted Rdx family selenoprotein